MSNVLSSSSSERRLHGLYQNSVVPGADPNAKSSTFQDLLTAGSSEAPAEPEAASDDDDSQQPSNEAYATVQVDGKTVATVYNDGTVVVPGQSLDSPLMMLPLVSTDGYQAGPALAQERAEDVARQLGGSVSLASSAQTQSEWEAENPDWAANATYVNNTANSDDTTISAQTLHAVQVIGQKDEEDSTKSDAVAAFREYMDLAHKGPGALMRAQYLASKGLTEDDVAAMSKADRDKLEKEIEDFIKKKFEEDTGIAVGETGVSSVA